MPTDYGNFREFCRDTSLPVCNLFEDSPTKNASARGFGPGGCVLTGIPLSGGRHLTNLGVILLDGIGILVTLFLLWRTQRKRAAVGRREMQLFLIGYMIIDICEIFSIGGFPLDGKVRIAFSGIHIGMITATTWMLMLNGAVGYQLVDDGTFVSMFLIVGSAVALFIGTGYIALDTGYDWSGYWNTDTIQRGYPFYNNREYSLYTLYLLAPMVFLFVYFVLETILVIKVLGEKKPMLFLVLAALLFIIGMIFDFVISVHICNGVNGKIDGSLFQTFFVLCSVAMIWQFWSSITEDDWPENYTGQQTLTSEDQAFS